MSKENSAIFSIFSKDLEKLKGLSREDLEKEISNKMNILFEKVDSYSQPKGRGQIPGSINRGMIGYTQTDALNIIKHETNVKGSSMNLIDLMSDELLKYRLLCIKESIKCCDQKDQEATDRVIVGASPHLNHHDYKELREDIEKVCSQIKAFYIINNKKTPLEELKENAVKLYNQKKEEKEARKKVKNVEKIDDGIQITLEESFPLEYQEIKRR